MMSQRLASLELLVFLLSCHMTLWSQDGSKVPLPETRTVVAVEYFIDRDPGKGQGTALVMALGNDVLDLEFVADDLKLSPGGHRLYLRFQDQLGQWGMPVMHSFFVMPNGFQTPTKVAGAELFIDEDPGEGEGLQLPEVQGNDLDIAITLDTKTVPPGGHEAYMRFQDARGRWSAPMRHPFFLLPHLEASSIDWRVTENEQVLSNGNELLSLNGSLSEARIETEALESLRLEGEFLVEAQLILNGTIPWLKAQVPFSFAAPPPPRLLFDLSELIQGGLGSSVSLRLNVPSQESITVEHSFDLLEWEILGLIEPGDTELEIKLFPGNRFFRMQSIDLPPLPSLP